MDNNGVLKKWKGCYYLNYPWDSSSWEVTELKLNKDYLRFRQISDHLDKTPFPFLARTPKMDSLGLNYNITRNQFKKLQKKGAFSKEINLSRKPLL